MIALKPPSKQEKKEDLKVAQGLKKSKKKKGNRELKYAKEDLRPRTDEVQRPTLITRLQARARGLEEFATQNCQLTRHSLLSLFLSPSRVLDLRVREGRFTRGDLYQFWNGTHGCERAKSFRAQRPWGEREPC